VRVAVFFIFRVVALMALFYTPLGWAYVKNNSPT